MTDPRKQTKIRQGQTDLRGIFYALLLIVGLFLVALAIVVV
ncbi:MAG: hypothetical protein SVU32_06020 [Candidatus Nanohaloarchaea archaeon]|nr:hypothetical protein [Candidatus Nanohaloarchaea archaeon]